MAYCKDCGKLCFNGWERCARCLELRKSIRLVNSRESARRARLQTQYDRLCAEALRARDREDWREHARLTREITRLEPGVGQSDV